MPDKIIHNNAPHAPRENPFSLVQMLRNFFDGTALSEKTLSTRALFNLMSGQAHEDMTDRQVIDDLNTILKEGLDIPNPCQITQDGEVHRHEIIHALINASFDKLSKNKHGLNEADITKDNYPQAFYDAFMLNYDYELYLDDHEMTGLAAAEVINTLDWKERLKPTLEIKDDAEPALPEMELDQMPMDTIPQTKPPAPAVPKKPKGMH